MIGTLNTYDGQGSERGLRGPVVEAAAASAGMVVFALFVRSGLPLVILSGVGLVATALAVANAFRAERRPAAILGFSPLSGKTGVFVVAGCAVGVGFGVLHRVTWEMGAVPSRLAPFAFVGACIGAAEELLYRGYVQGWLTRALVEALPGRGRSPDRPRQTGGDRAGCPFDRLRAGSDPPRRVVYMAVAVVVAALAHTAYKTALFAFPPAGVAIDLRYLAVWTLIGGVVFGALRELSGSVLAPLAAHVVFDIIVYGENVQAPWWVWS